VEVCPACGRPLRPFRAKLVCRTPGCGFVENCCDGGRLSRHTSQDQLAASALEESDLPPDTRLPDAPEKR
jgi:hypothetical protein